MLNNKRIMENDTPKLRTTVRLTGELRKLALRRGTRNGNGISKGDFTASPVPVSGGDDSRRVLLSGRFDRFKRHCETRENNSTSVEIRYSTDSQ